MHVNVKVAVPFPFESVDTEDGKGPVQVETPSLGTSAAGVTEVMSKPLELLGSLLVSTSVTVTVLPIP